jgi:4-hydroxymandelate oxidase
VNLETLRSLAAVEEAARRRLPAEVYDYVAGGAGDEVTAHRNVVRYQEILLRPRVMRDVSRLDPAVDLFGDRHAGPWLLAPVANQGLVHPDGERATARGASAAGVAMVVSSGANTEVRALAPELKVPWWFQLYVQPDWDLTVDIVRLAESAGARVLVVTVDAPVEGARHREARGGVRLPEGLGHPNYLGRARRPRFVSDLQTVQPQSLTWAMLERLCELGHLPVVVKGVLVPEDAVRALAAGARGIIVSNHGGRALDTTPATIDALPAVAEEVGGRVPVLVDGGIRRGTDVLKALALGARAVLVGRPYVYGLAVGGAAGVEHVLRSLRQEFLVAMAQAGCASIAEIDRSVLW